MATVPDKPSAGRSMWRRDRFQLGAALLIAVLLPWLIRIAFEVRELEWPGLRYSLAGTIVAVVGGFFAFRRLSRYPGVRAAYQIVPAYAAAYGLVLAFFFLTRLDYSRLHFSASFLLCLLWFYIVYFKLQRQRLRIGVVPSGNTRGLTEIETVDWVMLEPDRPLEGPLDAVVADLHAEMDDYWERFLADAALAGYLVMHVKQMEESLTGRVAIEHLSENNFGSLIPGIVYARLKRGADLVAAIALLPFLLLVFPLVALVIRLDSPGPILFRQRRMGYRGRPFTMTKFRTMSADRSEKADPRLAAITGIDDVRITRVGRWLRHTRLDELPQALNVLKGEMSWIGPRPEAMPLSEWYEAELPFYRYRHIVRPGITGWAQVKQGHVHSVEEVLGKLHYDFYYIKNFSFWLDLLILAGTVRIMITGRGAR